MTNLTLHDVSNRHMMRFRLNIGQAVCVNARGEERLYRQGQRIETPTNLTKRFGVEKFTRIGDSDPVDEGERFVAEMTEEDLQSVNDDDTGELRQRAESAQEEDSGEVIDKFDSSMAATYAAMSLEELVKLAGEEEIPLGSGKLTKKYVIQKLVDNDHKNAGH